MSKYAYSTGIGEYGAPVKLEINLEIKGLPVTSQEYDVLVNAFSDIETIARKYDKLLNIPEVEEETE